MKARIAIAFVTMIACFAAPRVIMASGAAPGSASLVYQTRASNVFVQSVLPR